MGGGGFRAIVGSGGGGGKESCGEREGRGKESGEGGFCPVDESHKAAITQKGSGEGGFRPVDGPGLGESATPCLRAASPPPVTTATRAGPSMWAGPALNAGRRGVRQAADRRRAGRGGGRAAGGGGERRRLGGRSRVGGSAPLARRVGPLGSRSHLDQAAASSRGRRWPSMRQI